MKPAIKRIVKKSQLIDSPCDPLYNSQIVKRQATTTEVQSSTEEVT